MTGLYAPLLPARAPTLSELIDRACDAQAALNDCHDAEWGRLNDRAWDAVQEMRRAIEDAGLTDALRRAADEGMI